MHTIALARSAMATRFEIVLHGDDPTGLRAAAEEVLNEIQTLEAQLSLYRPGSDIRRLNAHAATRPVRVEPGLFRLLKRAQQLSEETGGAFDITIAPLMDCWGFIGGTGRLPQPAETAQARQKVGWRWVHLNEADFTVRFARPGVMLDLGAIGKGYALERAADALRELGITSAFLHGGTSTVCALGAPPDAASWKVAIERPNQARPRLSRVGLAPPVSPGQADPFLAVIALRDASLSVSAIWGKSFESNGKTYGHIIDPRSGQPVEAALLAAVALPSATETDALSTALLVLGRPGYDQIAGLRREMRTLLVGRDESGQGLWVKAQGICAS